MSWWVSLHADFSDSIYMHAITWWAMPVNTMGWRINYGDLQVMGHRFKRWVIAPVLSGGRRELAQLLLGDGPEPGVHGLQAGTRRFGPN